MYGSGGPSGAGVAGVLAMLAAIVAAVMRALYHFDRAARMRQQRRTPPLPPPPPRRPVERWHEAPRGMEGPLRGPTRRPPINTQTLAEFRGQQAPAPPPKSAPAPSAPARLPRPPKEPEDERPTQIEVPQRLFVRAARMAAELQFFMPAMVRRRLGVDEELAERLMLALEGAGVIGSRSGLASGAQVLVKPDELPALFERFGIVEDALPPDAQPH